MPDIKGPLLVLWGDKDTLTPVDGPVGRFLQALPGRRPDTTFTMLPGKLPTFTMLPGKLPTFTMLPGKFSLMNTAPCHVPYSPTRQ